MEKVGLDAALFIRFTKMCRNIFLVLTVIGCGVIIPINIVAGHGMYSNYSDVSTFMKMTPNYMYGSRAFWAFVVCAYVFDIVICFFLWHNYRAVVRLRRAYFESPEYQASLHARTLLLTDIPKGMRTDEGIVKLTNDVKDPGEVPRAAIARNVKDLPDLVEEHEKAVQDLESVLAKYLKNPNNLPSKRPTHKVEKSDHSYKKGQKVDAIEYLTARIRELELEIKEVRESVDKRNALPYGFASYESISDAHVVAYAARKKSPQGTIMRLAPKPHDLIWKNLPMGKKQRRWQRFINNLWVTALTIVYIVPNVLTAVFLSNLSHLGQVWPAFETQLKTNPTWWAIVQGVLAPAITSAFYYFLPAIFRRLSMKAGDTTKTSRERHVMHKMYSFFIFNNLIVFSLFAAIWGFITAVIGASKGESTWDAIKDGDIYNKIVTTMITVSPYWISWLLQRNLGAAVDLSQFVNLAWGSFSRKFLSPTPRELIKLSAPQPFDYAGYYNYFLFYSTVAMCFATLQPLILAVTFVYFWLDSYLKKYLLLYVFITKTESGGQFWRVLFNRFIFLAFLGNVVIALLVTAQGSSWAMLYALAPLPFLLLAFKWYCAQAFDNKCSYYTTGRGIADAELAIPDGKKHKRGDRVGVRFGHPVLYKPLITPMVHAKSQHLLRSIYAGRTSLDEDNASVAGYSDVYMDTMSHSRPGKRAGGGASAAPFEIVTEGQMDFEHYMNRPEFRDELGGGGELYGRPEDLIRPGTPGSFMTQEGTVRSESRGRSGSGSDSRSSSRTRVGEGPGTMYPTGYHKAPGLREQSPAESVRSVAMGSVRGRNLGGDDYQHLLHGAARMGRSPVPAPTPGAGYGGPGGYAPVRLGLPEGLGDGHILTPENVGAGDGYTPGTDTEEDTSYDYFRRGRQAR